MNTLEEIETAVNQLPAPERANLLERLSRPSEPPKLPPEEARARMEQWLEKLDRLRASGVTGKQGTPLQEILNDIRADRC